MFVAPTFALHPVYAAAIALALASPAACLAADWVRVPAAGVDQHFYDQSKVSISGDEVTYWRKVVFARPVRVKAGTAKSALYRERMHCRDHPHAGKPRVGPGSRLGAGARGRQ